MPTVPLQELATEEEFDIYGVDPSRHNASSEKKMSHVRAASGDILTALEPWCRLPLLEWGENVVLHVCAIAAWNMRGVDGFDPQGDEFDSLKVRWDASQSFITEIAEKKKAPYGVVDSTDESAVDENGNAVRNNPNKPRVKGYARRNYTPW